MMSKAETIEAVWRRELAASEPPAPDEPVDVVFDFLPCKARPFGLDSYIRSGRIPTYLASAALSLQARDQKGADKALSAVSSEDMIEGQRFQRFVVCKVMHEPRVADVPPGQEPEGSFSYMELAERRPAFVDAVMLWVLLGCPVSRKEGEGEGLDAEALKRFPAGKRRAERTRAGDNRKNVRPKSVAATARKPA
jgi:hypothetical protein